VPCSGVQRGCCGDVEHEPAKDKGRNFREYAEYLRAIARHVRRNDEHNSLMGIADRLEAAAKADEVENRSLLAFKLKSKPLPRV
jgi:hypothetical protein